MKLDGKTKPRIINERDHCQNTFFKPFNLLYLLSTKYNGNL